MLGWEQQFEEVHQKSGHKGPGRVLDISQFDFIGVF